jgi:hypothetical protein
MQDARVVVTNGHGKCAAPDNETCYARFPLSNFPPHTGERANESLREFHVKDDDFMQAFLLAGEPSDR